MNTNIGIRIFSKLTCWATFFLIFVGAMVNSTGSGLAVPDWPLSYGMWFPPMVGGVFYEHGHRMVASVVGFMMLVLALWLFFKDNRKWVKVTGFIGLAAVIIQGILGGITVLYYLPTPVSVAHGVLAQTFFLITIFIAYSVSVERGKRAKSVQLPTPKILKWSLILLACIYIQLMLGAVMRHTESGLAIYDFPTMAGQWIPTFNETMMSRINLWRFDNGFDMVTKEQVIYHFNHRVGAALVTIAAVILNIVAINSKTKNTKVLKTIFVLDILLAAQIILGIMTVFTLKQPLLTSIHVVIGAGILGVTFLLVLRAAPLKYGEAIKCLQQK